MKRLILLFFILIPLSSIAQDKKVLYEMVKLDRKVNSRYHDAAPIVSPDGNTLYFFIANHPENNFGTDNSQDIWYTEKDEHGEWKEAVHMPAPLNTHRFNQVLSVMSGGNVLFTRGGRGSDDSGFSFTRRSGNGWTTPDPISVNGYEKMKKGVFSGGCMSVDGNVLLLYFSETEKSKYSDLYISFREGDNRYSKPVKIGEPISSRRDEFGPFLTADMKTMYFASNRWDGLGSTDIYRTERLDDTWLKWSEPVNIGEPVNTDGFDAYFTIDAAGKNAFTTRAFMSADGGHLDIIGLVPRPEIILSGTVRNKESNEVIQTGLEYMIIEKDTGWVETNEQGFYETTLTRRGIYQFVAVKDGFEIMRDSIDLTKAEDYAEITRDFYMIPKKAEIVLFGYVMEEGTGSPVEADLNLLKEGRKLISTHSDAIQGYYKTSLSGSGTYVVTINKEEYLPFADTLALVTEKQFEEFQRDFHLTPRIELSGYVINQKSNEFMPMDITYEDESGKQTRFSSDLNGYYHLFLPNQGKYYFRAGKEGFINLSDSIIIENYIPGQGITKDLYMIPIEVGVTVRLNNIFFDFDKATLRPESFPELDRVVEFLNQNNTIKVEIGGHTDSMGSDEYNQRLSQGRAESVMNYLVEKGIPSVRVEARGYGESQPEATNDTEAGRQTNRRVEFKVVDK